MQFSWTGVLLAPLLVPVLVSAALAGLLGGNHPVFGFLLLLVLGCVISYGVTVFLFLPCLFLLSAWRPTTGFRVCLLGLGLGVVTFVLMTWVEWKSSGPDSGPPVDSFFMFFWRWAANPMTAICPLAGLITAGAYWRLGTWRNGQPEPAVTRGEKPTH
jgi:hypothetical protein